MTFIYRLLYIIYTLEVLGSSWPVETIAIQWFNLQVKNSFMIIADK